MVTKLVVQNRGYGEVKVGKFASTILVEAILYLKIILKYHMHGSATLDRSGHGTEV